MEEAFSILVVAEWKSVLEAQQPEITEELGTLQRLLARSHTTREGQVAQKRQRGGASGAGPLFQGAGEAVASSPGGGRWPAGGRQVAGFHGAGGSRPPPPAVAGRPGVDAKLLT